MSKALEVSHDPFAQPADLWVFPPPRASRWFSRMDWYLNWQMSKGLSYPGLHLPLEVLTIAESFDGDLPKARDRKADDPLLVISLGRLPAGKCVVVEGEDQFKPWLKKVFDLALKLNVSSVHVFLPAKVSLDQALKAWEPGSFTAGFTEDAGQ